MNFIKKFIIEQEVMRLRTRIEYQEQQLLNLRARIEEKQSQLRQQ